MKKIEDIQDLMNKARVTNNKDEQLFFSKHPSSLVRKSLATNSSISDEILKKLLRDPTVNVSFFANQKSLEKRVFNEDDLKNRCVLCKDVLNDVSKCERC